jgi:hypothetical protein
MTDSNDEILKRIERATRAADKLPHVRLKPREFWIEHCHLLNCDVAFQTKQTGAIHVIEHSAHLEALALLREYKETCPCDPDVTRDFLAFNQKLDKFLEQY